jgi:hypothetical protein
MIIETETQEKKRETTPIKPMVEPMIEGLNIK